MVVVIAIDINLETLVIEQILSGSAFFGDAISTIVKHMIEDALCTVIEHIRCITVIRIGYAVIIEIGEEGKTGDTDRNAP